MIILQAGTEIPRRDISGSVHVVESQARHAAQALQQLCCNITSFGGTALLIRVYVHDLRPIAMTMNIHVEYFVGSNYPGPATAVNERDCCFDARQ